MRYKIFGAALGLAAAGMIWAFPLTAAAEPVFPEGISAGGRSLDGRTRQEALDSIQEEIDAMAGQKITLTVDGQDVETTAADLGFYWSNKEAIDEAAEQYTGGSLIRQYMTEKDLKAAPVELEVKTQVDSGRVSSFVEEQCQGITAEPVDAVLTRENGQFVITEGRIGKAVDTAATEAALNEALAGGLKEPVQVTAVITEQQPARTAEALSSVTDVLGTFTTSFSSSGASRSTNITVGASKINGRVLMPGEILSGYECLQPFTTANGYRTAAAYENGQVVDSIGGGVCQISTTLYNAALLSEIEIVQRQNHSMSVSYVKPSMDSAIAGTYKDLKIKNNYSTPIYVEGYTTGKQLTFTIYGKETRPANRKVSFVSETLGTTSPGDPQLIVDNSLAPGAKVRVQSSHTGLKSRLWKVVTVDGVETERTILHKDTYNASKAIYRVGPTLPAVVPPADQTVPPSADPSVPPSTDPSVPAQGSEQTTGASGGDSGAAAGSNGGPGAAAGSGEGSGGGPGAAGADGGPGVSGDSGSSGGPGAAGSSDAGAAADPGAPQITPVA